MRAFSRDISVLSVASWLTNKDSLYLIGGREYLDDLVEQAGAYQDALTDLLAYSVRRELQQTGALISIEAANEGITADQAIDNAEQRLMNVRRRGANEVHVLGDYADHFLSRIHRQREGDFSDAFYTGWDPLDRILGGAEKNDFMIIGGRPGDGKSTVLKWLAFKKAIEPAADNRQGVYIGNFEEGEGMFVMKFIAIMTGISTSFLKKPSLLNDPQLELVQRAVTRMKSCPLFFDTGSGITPAVYKSRVMKAKRESLRKFNVPLVFNSQDYIQRMLGDGETETSRAKYVSNKSRDMAMSDQLDMPTISTAQLNRTPVDGSGNTREYVATDLKETGALEQDASILIFIKRPWMMNPPPASLTMQFLENREVDGSPTDKWQVEPIQIYTVKNRNDGAPAYTPMLVWHRYCGQYELLSDYQQRVGFTIAL